MASKPDIVALKWVVGLMNKQAEDAETALVEYTTIPRRRRRSCAACGRSTRSRLPCARWE